MIRRTNVITRILDHLSAVDDQPHVVTTTKKNTGIRTYICVYNKMVYGLRLFKYGYIQFRFKH